MILIPTPISLKTTEVSSPLLLAGRWCEINNEDFLKAEEYQVVKYPWDDRKKLVQAYEETERIYNILLPKLSQWLNDYHGENHTEKYWEIIIGIWLRYFIQMIYDRYEVISSAVSECSGLSAYILSNEIVPKDFNDFFKKHTEDDFYNSHIFSQILEYFKDQIHLYPFPPKSSQEDRKSISPQKTNFKRQSIEWVTKTALFIRGSSNFIYHPGISFKDQILLALQLKTFPASFLPRILPLSSPSIRSLARNQTI